MAEEQKLRSRFAEETTESNSEREMLQRRNCKFALILAGVAGTFFILTLLIVLTVHYVGVHHVFG